MICTYRIAIRQRDYINVNRFFRSKYLLLPFLRETYSLKPLQKFSRNISDTRHLYALMPEIEHYCVRCEIAALYLNYFSNL